MAKWYVEYVEYGKYKHMGQIEANTGNDAIKYVRDHVLGLNRIRCVWHDDDIEEEKEVNA